MSTTLFILLVGAFLVILSSFASIFWFGGLLLPAIFGGGPFVPTSYAKTQQMIRLANLTPNDRVADLGCGDGRILFAAIKAGARSAIGYEIHPGLVAVCRLFARIKHISDKIQVKQKSFWKAELGDVNVVFLYQLPKSMIHLADKLKTELPKGSRIISHAFPFKNWEPIKKEDNIYVYQT